MEPVRDYFRYACRLFCELQYRVAGRCRLVAYDRLALDVRVRNRPGFALSGPSDVCTGNASLFGDAR